MAGEARLWQTLNEQVVEERAGGDSRTADAVVLVQTAPDQTDQTALFLRGFYAGLGSGGAPVVAVQSSNTTAGTDLYGTGAISTVDDLDKPAGRLALALLLAGAPPGQYGVKPSDTGGILPPLRAAPPVRG